MYSYYKITNGFDYYWKRGFMSKSKIESLLEYKDIGYSKRWHPTTVSTFVDFLSNGYLKDMSDVMRKNIAYSLQYLEYLELQLLELNLHSVIRKIVYKNFIITGVSIIEGVFGYLLRQNNLWAMEEWDDPAIIDKKQFRDKEFEYKLEKKLYRKLDEPYEKNMAFTKIIDLIENKKILSLNHNQYLSVRKLKDMRNRVHLQGEKEDSISDWFVFEKKDYMYMKRILYTILTLPEFENDSKAIAFLHVEE